MSVTYNITIETRITEMEGKLRETYSYIIEILKLLTQGRTANPPKDITLVPESPVWCSSK